MKIKLFDLKKQCKSIESEVKVAINSVLESGCFILGNEVSSFEKEAAEYLGVKYAVGVASGTDALTLALLACGVQKGKEVITTPFTFVATAESIIHSGAVPVFVDIDDRTYNLNAAEVEAKISEKTAAVLPVHMYGQPAEMDELIKIADKHNIPVIEDAAQAFGAEYKNKKAGTIGNAGCFSFFPTKNFGAYGDAGMIVTNDENIAEQVKMLRDHGSRQKYIHDTIGYNSRLDAIQAAILRVKLKYIDKWNEIRREKAYMYNELLKGSNAAIPVEKEYNKHIYHQYTVRIKNRDECKDYLMEHGVSTAIHYPLSVFEQKCFKYLGYTTADFPESFNATREVLSLPMYPELPEEEMICVCNNIKNFKSIY